MVLKMEYRRLASTAAAMTLAVSLPATATVRRAAPGLGAPRQLSLDLGGGGGFTHAVDKAGNWMGLGGFVLAVGGIAVLVHPIAQQPGNTALGVGGLLAGMALGVVGWLLSTTADCLNFASCGYVSNDRRASEVDRLLAQRPMPPAVTAEVEILDARF